MARLDGVAAGWLASRRDDLNARFAMTRRRFPQLDGQAVLAWVARALPPLADASPTPEPLLGALYDLILLQVGRGRLGSPDGPPTTALGVLLLVTFPALKRLLAASPGTLVGALANATENLGERGRRFATGLTEVGRDAPSPAALLDGGSLLAWRLGEARLRASALGRVAALPPGMALRALGVGDFPPAAAPLLAASLVRDAWIAPSAVFRDETLRSLASDGPAAAALVEHRLDERDQAPVRWWQVAAALGDFSGFGGEFDDPPLCLDTGGPEDRHRFQVLSTAGVYCLEADLFGCVCTPTPGVTTLPPTGTDRNPPVASQATSAIRRRALAAWTTADSFRVRIAVPQREPL